MANRTLTIPPASRNSPQSSSPSRRIPCLPWHSHPFPNAVYVLSGTLTLHDRDSGKTRVLHQGEAAAEEVDAVHRGETGEEPAVLLITYAGTPGVPTSVPAKGEKAEY